MVAQRATSTSSITSSGYHTVDRWHTDLFSLGTWIQSRETDVPSGVGTDVQFEYSLKMLNTATDDSPASNNYCILQQHIEGQNLQSIGKGTNNARPLVLSFWVKGNVVGRYNVSLRDQDNTRFCTRPYIIKKNATWQQVVVKFPADNTGTLGADNNKSLTVEFWLGAGSNFSSGSGYVKDWTTDGTTRAAGNVNVAAKSGGYFMITGVQLELGEENTVFEHLPYDIILQRCHRYCYVEKLFSGSSGYGSSFAGYNDANYIAFRVNPPQPMRIPPSSVTEVGDVNVWRGNTTYTGWSWGFILGSHGISTFYVSANKSSHGLGTNADYLIQYPSASDALIFSAEL